MYNVEIFTALFILFGAFSSLALSHSKLKERVKKLEEK